MTFDTRYSIGKIAESAHKGDYGIMSQNIGNSKTEAILAEERRLCPWRDCYIGKRGGTNGTSKPPIWSAGDTFLAVKIGTKVKYKESTDWRDKGEIKKYIGRYSSPIVRQQLLSTGLDFEEQELLFGVNYVNESLNLKGTGASFLPNLKMVGDNLILDSASSLEDLSGLEEVGGKLTVIAKNKDEMNAYLQKLGLMDDTGNLCIKTGKGLEFIMKNYV